MNWSIRWRLSLMMFLQYAIWGAWAPFLWKYLVDSLGMSGAQAGVVFGMLALACILAPFTGGQIADRWVSTEKFLGVVHLGSGVVLYFLAKATGFTQVTTLMGVYCLLYAPTLALTNSIAFTHIEDQRIFGQVRVLGTLGWIFAGFLLAGWRAIGTPVGVADCVLLAAAFSIIQGLFCFFLPHTPPARDKAADPLAFREAFVMLKDKNFLIFMIIAFVVTTELQFYYGPTEQFLGAAMKVPGSLTPIVLSVAQAAELLAMALLLSFALRNWGVRKTMALGTIAWPLRYVVFALAPLGPLAVMKPLVIASLTLHGLGYTLFFVASQVYVDMVAPKNIRASAQSLLALVTLGIGTWLGVQFTGFMMDYFKPGEALANWTPFFLVPCALTVACAVAFLLFFRDEKAQAKVKG
ncbi:MAG: MFS transporter [Armatimonadota bacterium]|jgi:nucleoside transporter